MGASAGALIGKAVLGGLASTLTGNATQSTGSSESNSNSMGWSTGQSSAKTYGQQATEASYNMMREANNYNTRAMELQMQYNAAQALANREWQERMSNTAIQRQVADMKKAGINPILAAQYGGSSTPAGAAANMTGISSAMGASHADSESNSSNSSKNTSSSKAWSKEEMSSNIVNQLDEEKNALLDTIDKIWNYEDSSGKKVSERVEEAREKIHDAIEEVREDVKNINDPNKKSITGSNSKGAKILDFLKKQIDKLNEFHGRK